MEKPSKAPRRKPETPEEWERHYLAKASAHVLRVDILAALDRGGTSQSPNMLRIELDESLNLIAYHMRVLEKCGAIELVDTKQKRGATEHFYRPTGTVPYPLRTEILAALESAAGPLTPGQLASALSQPRAMVAFHVSILEDFGAVERIAAADDLPADKAEFVRTGKKVGVAISRSGGLIFAPAARELLLRLVDDLIDNGLRKGVSAADRAAGIEARQQLLAAA